MKPLTLTRRRVLVIDDNESIHADFRKILAPTEQVSGFAAAKAAFLGGADAAAAPSKQTRFDFDTASQGQEGVQKAQAACEAGEPYLMAFVDMRMPPGWDGATTIRHLWRVDPQIQVVICTAFSDCSLEALADELGHSDQLLILKKPFDNAEVYQLAAALCEKRIAAHAALMKREELEHLVQERTAEIEHAMLHDKLTGLPNRALLLTRLDACLERRKRRADAKFAVLFLDFDRFKLINDSLGHEMGDLLLIEIATRLRERLRTTDSVCHTCTPSRLGGDEFIVLLEDLKEERDAARVAERLLSVLAEPYELEGQKLHVTASIGIATSDRDYSQAGDMLRDADTAMYRAKAAGRARYVMFDTTMHREVMARLSLETELRRAVLEDELTEHYQPIVRLSDGKLAGFEVLVRWTHPQRGPVPAAELIAVAEETGLIRPLSINQLRRACLQLKDWQARYPEARDLTMSVNLSRRLLIDPDLVTKIGATVRETGIDPRSLALEITESAMLKEDEDTLRVFDDIKQMGIWLHLDDFGTGYSSLACLYKLPLSALKIDRAFLCEACARREHTVVLEAITRIARAFKLQIIAEGIEEPEQLELLRGLGIEHGQGYLFGRPTDAASAETFLQGRPVLCAV